LTMTLAAELGVDGTRVVGIAPGMVGSQAILERLEPHHKETVLKGQIIKRFGEMGDLVGAVLFLCSHDAGFITGQTLLVDGGFVPRA
jgi:3-oxoacyl-[acyl-carrier protein] reductase